MVHGDGSKDSESSHNNEPECIAVLGFGCFENSSGKGEGNRGSVVLKGVDYASGKSSHFLSPDIHWRGRANDGVGGVSGKGDEDQDCASQKNPPRSRPHMAEQEHDGCD